MISLMLIDTLLYTIKKYPNLVGSWKAGGLTLVGDHAKNSQVLDEQEAVVGTAVNSLIR